MIDSWILVWSQIGSVVLWCFAVVALGDIISQVRFWGWPEAFIRVCVDTIVGALLGWAAWWLWP